MEGRAGCICFSPGKHGRRGSPRSGSQWLVVRGTPTRGIWPEEDSIATFRTSQDHEGGSNTCSIPPNDVAWYSISHAKSRFSKRDCIASKGSGPMYQAQDDPITASAEPPTSSTSEFVRTPFSRSRSAWNPLTAAWASSRVLAPTSGWVLAKTLARLTQ